MLTILIFTDLYYIIFILALVLCLEQNIFISCKTSVQKLSTIVFSSCCPVLFVVHLLPTQANFLKYSFYLHILDYELFHLSTVPNCNINCLENAIWFLSFFILRSIGFGILSPSTFNFAIQNSTSNMFLFWKQLCSPHKDQKP